MRAGPTWMWALSALLGIGLCGAFVPARAWAQSEADLDAQALVTPDIVQLGERATYRGRVIVDPRFQVRWLPPEPSDPLTWGTRQAGRNPRWDGGGGHRKVADTVWVEIPLQAFELGELEIPGLRFEYRTGTGAAQHRLPAARLRVVSVLTAADSNARFRALQGPIAAPWWERVPWMIVALVVSALAALVGAILWARRRRRPTVTPPVPIQARPRHPGAEALAALAALRARELPRHGRFGEHAFELGQILRRFVEATIGTTRPGDTTPELVDHLRLAGLGSGDLQRLAGLLQAWDRVKFARAPMTVDEAVRTESAVEAFVRGPSPGSEAQVA
ncbi:MAG TPA: hypothetical protein VEY91_03200 [Candidatus Limnocylindria bacterium]|nr:hypothetical protein [Candidatus Limnocylindria bacterium]